MNPPPKPWESGKHPTYTAYRLVITVCQDEFGNLWSEHDFLTPEDKVVAEGTRYQGVPQVAHALLTEAVLREVYTSAMVLMSRDPQFLVKIREESESRQAVVEELAKGAQHVFSETAKKMLPGALTAVLNMLLSSQGGDIPSSPQG